MKPEQIALLSKALSIDAKRIAEAVEKCPTRSIQPLPDKEYLFELRGEINNLLMRKMNDTSDMWLINQIVDHHKHVYAHIETLEEMIVKLQDKVLFAKEIYDELLEEYGKISEREINMIVWIINKKNNDRANNKR
jgi:hypothetical protein